MPPIQAQSIATVDLKNPNDATGLPPGNKWQDRGCRMFWFCSGNQVVCRTLIVGDARQIQEV
jgi:hypothetical protein